MKRKIFLISHLSFLICIAMTMAAMLTLSGCIEEFEADIPSEDSDLLVVEGTICSGQNTFILSRTQAIHEGQSALNLPQMVTGAAVSVRGSDGSEYRTQGGNGNYACQIDRLAPDVEYYLHIETSDGEVYESELQKPLPTEAIAEISGVENAPEGSIDMLVTPDVPFESDQAKYYTWTYDETWEVYPDYTTNMYYDTTLKKGIFKMYQFPERGWIDATGSTIMVGTSVSYEGQHIQRLKLYDIGLGDERIFHRYSSLVRQRAISKAEYEYELARQQAGTEMGGLFTPLPSALPTNIRCLTSDKHVIGFVGCSLNTSEYRIFLDAEDFSVRYPRRTEARLLLDDPSDALCLRLVKEGYFLCKWDDDRMFGGKLETAWALEYQLDVRYKGAYIERPDFWIEKENKNE